MKNRYSTLSAAVLCAALLSATGAHAQHPALQKAGDLQYVCGGIGIDESTAMRAAMKDYPLSLLFATRSGDYLAKIQVVIEGRKARKLDSFRRRALSAWSDWTPVAIRSRPALRVARPSITAWRLRPQARLARRWTTVSDQAGPRLPETALMRPWLSRSATIRLGPCWPVMREPVSCTLKPLAGR